ncbi:uncharacterized protein N7443_002804 [Penicillium atrosanguineum]|uniref:uncharacterized protein n=1 Tax=Penicillium atrosanguineum TaxID=1132637 RepID=UPI00238E0D53|nr:uncharacterized protein N7443_002804 [Penicillium atrosanguineum]KAJ5310343.1 hypothetical protein N7443_002804 [Penicillium atrosanguineum]
MLMLELMPAAPKPLNAQPRMNDKDDAKIVKSMEFINDDRRQGSYTATALKIKDYQRWFISPTTKLPKKRQISSRIKLEVQVMEIRKTKLGTEHPETLKSMGNLALAFWNQGRWEEAEQFFVQAIETSKTKLGTD